MLSEYLVCLLCDFVLIYIYFIETKIKDMSSRRIRYRRALLMAIFNLILLSAMRFDHPEYVGLAYAMVSVTGWVIMGYCRRIGGIKLSPRKRLAAIAFPFIAIVLCLSDMAYLKVDLLRVVVLISIIPSIMILIYSIAGLFRSRIPLDKRALFISAMINLPLVVAGFAQMAMLNHPVLEIGLMMAMFIAYVSIIVSDVNMDMSVRVYGPDYLANRIRKAISKGETVTVAMCQIHGSEEIVYNYGHRESAKILITYAKHLKEACAGTDIVVGRYKAGKFLLISKGSTEELERICYDIRERAVLMTRDKPYSLRTKAAIGRVSMLVSMESMISDLEKEYLYTGPDYVC